MAIKIIKKPLTRTRISIIPVDKRGKGMAGSISFMVEGSVKSIHRKVIEALSKDQGTPTD